ncbi:hypothetical protein Y032_0118g716 [Ancylostoma ceylanicum]|nr:hypothetical protein Y032_0118g716 [Ancylostoma ceylanicum]
MLFPNEFDIGVFRKVVVFQVWFFSMQFFSSINFPLNSQSECLHKSNTLSSASIDGFFGRECHGRELERRLATCIGGVLMLAVNLSTTNFELQQPLDFEMG